MINRFQNILRHVPKRNELTDLANNRVVLVRKKDNEYVLKFGKVIKIGVMTYNDLAREVRTANSIITDVGSESGECGSAYVLDEKSACRRLIGVHFAGSEGRAYGVPLVYEDIVKVIGDPKEHLETPLIPSETPALLQGNVNFLGRAVHRGEPVNQFYSGRSNLRKTQVFNCVMESKVMPACLDARLEVDSALAKALAKQYGPVFDVDQGILEKASHCYKKKLAEMKTEPLEVLSLGHAIEGIADDPFIRGIARSKSAGYPWALETRQRGKTEWYGNDEWTLESVKAQEMRASPVFASSV